MVRYVVYEFILQIPFFTIHSIRVCLIMFAKFYSTTQLDMKLEKNGQYGYVFMSSLYPLLSVTFNVGVHYN